MSTSAHRQYLRWQRQAKRSQQLTPDALKNHREASVIYVMFGHEKRRTIQDCIDQVAKMEAGLSKRELRARRREVMQAEERQKLAAKMALEKKKHAQHVASRNEGRAQKIASKLKSTFMRKGVA